MTDDRFFFLHMQKTAGTTVFLRLSPRCFPRHRVYPMESDADQVGATRDVSYLERRWREIGSSVQLVAGHFPLCTTELLGGGFRIFTVLRDPVERTLSFLRHQQESDPWARERSLEEIYEEPVRLHGFIHNHMVKMLSLELSEMSNGALTMVPFDEGRLRTAQAALAERIEVFGFQEHLEELFDQLRAVFGWDLGHPGVFNATRSQPVEQAFRDRIAHDNELDVRLYAFARELHRTRHPG